MNILYHHRTQARGAEGVHIREIVNSLRAMGHRVHVVSPPGIDIFSDNINDSVRGKRFELRNIFRWASKVLPQISFELLELCYNLIALSNIKRILDEEKVDFIYERYAFFGFAGTYCANKYNVPIVLEVNEIAGIKRLRKQALSLISKNIEKNIFGKVDAIIVVSRFLKNNLIMMGVPQSKITVMQNAVNINAFSPHISGEPIRSKYHLDGKIILGFVGTFAWWDNLTLLINLFAELIKEYCNIHLVLIGDGAERESLQVLVKNMNLDNNVTFTGRLPSSSIPGYIAALDLCIIPGSNNFGSPIVLFEYMAMGKSIVAPRLEPIEDIVRQNENGVLFESGIKDALRRAIVGLLNDNDYRKRLGLNARNAVLNNYRWELNANRVISIYWSISRGHNKPGIL